MLRPTRLALALCWSFFAITVFLAWRKVMAAPEGDVTLLVVATACEAAGFALLATWLQDQGSQQTRSAHSPTPRRRPPPGPPSP